MLKQIILVGLGGASGSILRFLVSEITGKYNQMQFPLATFTVNMLGCFLIGILINVIPTNPNLRMLLIVGFCGGFTTFSSLAKESFILIEANQLMLAVLYTAISCVLGIALVFLGNYISK